MENQKEPKCFVYPGLKYSKDNVSIVVTLDSRRQKKNKLFPVRIQVVYNRLQRFYPTGKDLSIDDWKELPETKGKKLVSIRNDIKNTFEKVETAIKTLIYEDKFSFDTLNLRLGKCISDTLNMAFIAKMEALKNGNHEVEDTVKAYKDEEAPSR